MRDLIDLETTHARQLFGSAMRRARLSVGVSQRGLASMAGLNQSTICRLELGTIGGLRYATLMRILVALEPREISIVGTPWLYRVLQSS